jgi:hypothetical protein
VAVRGDELVLIEMKSEFQTSLLIQAAERQKICDSVYVALPFPSGKVSSNRWKGIRHLLRRLELGLLFVHMESGGDVEVVFHPLPFEKKKNASRTRALLREVEERSYDFNSGGSTRRKLVTAYRENALHIAYFLLKRGPLSPKELRALGTGKRTLSILSSNFYKWFTRVDRGIYSINPEGVHALEEFAHVVDKILERNPDAAFLMDENSID